MSGFLLKVTILKLFKNIFCYKTESLGLFLTLNTIFGYIFVKIQVKSRRYGVFSNNALSKNRHEFSLQILNIIKKP